MKIQFIKDHGNFKAGWVIGTSEPSGQRLIDLGVATQVADHIRLLKYKVNQPLAEECIIPDEETPPAPKEAKKPVFSRPF
jgi:hypothetical protein